VLPKQAGINVELFKGHRTPHFAVLGGLGRPHHSVSGRPASSGLSAPGGKLMTVDETRRVLGDYLDALLGGGDFAAYFADDVQWTTTETGEVISGADAVRDFITAFHTELFDASPEIGPTICGDGVAALEATFVGKHIAEFAGVAATGTQVRLPYSVFYELDDGKIMALRAYLPLSSLVEQLRGADALPTR
jgi:steroid delta-isomerase-like uncharacterized protein